jgi:glycerophosphoryl diester phosphodiesterase
MRTHALYGFGPVVAASAFFLSASSSVIAQQASAPVDVPDPFLALMTKAAAHARQHGDEYVPALSPVYNTLLGENPPVDVKKLQAAGFLVVPWTVDDLPSIRQMIELHVDGIISDRPDLLAVAVKEAREQASGDATQIAYLDQLDVEGHRGGRGLRPENTLPAFEAGMDNGIHSIETDTGVTTDHESLIWHDQFLNPQSCHRVDGQPYTLENRVYTHDISMVEAQKQFICDKLHFGEKQTNDLALSPVSVAFAAKEHMVSPYAPTYVRQLFRFVEFYTEWYRRGPGKSSLDAAARVHTGETVHFNLETKILPPGYSDAKTEAVVLGKTVEELKASGKVPEAAFTPSRTVDPEVFVDTLCGAVMEYHMEKRSDIQSFDYRTLQLVEEKYPKIRTFYLTSSPRLLYTDFVPASLRSVETFISKP